MKGLLLGLSLIASLSFVSTEAIASCNLHSTNPACQTRVCRYWDHSTMFTVCELGGGAYRYESCYTGNAPWNWGYSGCETSYSCPPGTLCY